MSKILPNQIAAHNTAADAWEYAKKLIDRFGSHVITEDRKMTKEIMNMHLCVLHPAEGWPIVGSGWDIPALERYAKQLLSPENPGFDYTYGERLRAYNDTDAGEIDQLLYIIDKLERNKTTRRAIAITWQPWWDNDAIEHVPCLQLIDFLFRDDALRLTAFFRSHDIAQAYPANLYGLNKLLEYVSKEAGMLPGSITTISASAHIYEV